MKEWKAGEEESSKTTVYLEIEGSDKNCIYESVAIFKSIASALKLLTNQSTES